MKTIQELYENVINASVQKKYELIQKEGKFWRIRSLIDIPGIVKSGELGGLIESENNLSHKGKCWINYNAKVYDNAKVFDNAQIHDNAQIYESADIFENAEIFDDSRIFNNAKICEYTKVFND